MTWPTTMEVPAEHPGIRWCHAQSAATRSSPAFGPMHAFRRNSLGLKGAHSLCGGIEHPGEVFSMGTFHYCSVCVEAVVLMVAPQENAEEV